jgi:hypothetical protein
MRQPLQKKFCLQVIPQLLTKSRIKYRRIRRNIFQDIIDSNLALKDTEKYKQILNLRQIWCEGTFGAQKQNHNLKQLFRRGIEAATDHCLLSATALNLKRMARCLG